MSLIEFFKLIQKIFIGNKIRITFIYLTCILYLSCSLTQIYFFLNLDLTNKLLLIFILSVCIATDIGGYIFGKIFKGKKLSKISPNKTYSGLIGSYILSFFIFYYFYSNLNLSLNFLIITFIVCSVSQIGDLFISYLKRKAKVKNTGSLLPGHGGILDRIDGIIFAVPIGINLLFIL
tara:strand:- start:279 stop:809 length:531 start_codon:yes stop_codon:yes gene_type:complete